MDSEFRRLPSVDKVLSDERIESLEETYPHDLLVEFIRQSLEDARLAITEGKPVPTFNKIVSSVCRRVQMLEAPTLRRVINATGVILHTNLGRAPLSTEAIAAMSAVSGGYSNLEFNLGAGTRGSRHVHIESVLCQLTGAEAAMVVNNNASAVLLGLTALAKRKEVIVSRGEAVEIGGGFRVPDVMRQSGARLVEVGTTNCTYAADYEQAVTPRTAAVMRVHSSNFRLVGFIHSVTIEEIVALAGRCDLPVLDDLGSGCFLDTTVFGLDAEPMVQQSISSGAGAVFFSGDKLVGGPQAGIIVGKKEYIDRLKRHPLARAVRIDKVRLAGLRATLLHYLKNEATARVPVWRMISSPLAEIERRANVWAKAMGKLAVVAEGESVVGGGSLPGGTLPTRLVAVGGGKKGQNIARKLSERLRARETPVVGRVNEDILYLDPRSVLPEEDEAVIQALRRVAADLNL